MSILNPLDCPYYLITRLNLQVTSVLEKKLIEAGASDVKPAYLGSLLCLWDKDGQKMIHLARCARLPPSTMTGLIDRMERDGFLYRAVDPSDRRAQIIRLTGKGKATKVPCRKVVDDMFAMIFNDFSKEEVDITMETLTRMLTKFEKQDKKTEKKVPLTYLREKESTLSSIE